MYSVDQDKLITDFANLEEAEKNELDTEMANLESEVSAVLSERLPQIKAQITEELTNEKTAKVHEKYDAVKKVLGKYVTVTSEEE